MPEWLLALAVAGGVLFPALEPGTRLGAVRIEEAVDDARGRAIPAGAYSLRYVRQPPLKDHVDTAENPDFALVLPVAQERERWTPEELVAAGRAASGGHPWVLALVPEGTPGSETLGAGTAVVLRSRTGGRRNPPGPGGCTSCRSGCDRRPPCR